MVIEATSRKPLVFKSSHYEVLIETFFVALYLPAQPAHDRLYFCFIFVATGFPARLDVLKNVFDYIV